MEALRSQFIFYLGALAALPFFPILLWQGWRGRAAVPRLPEAGGPRTGTTGEGGHPLQLLTLGESTVAGVGVSDHGEGITGQLARQLHKASGRPVQWQVLAQSGFTAKQVRLELVPEITTAPIDYIVIGLGGNDTFKLHSPLSWRREMARLIRAIREKQPRSRIVIMSLPPVGGFPAFPRSLQLPLGRLVHLHARAIRDLPEQFGGVYFLSTPVSFESWKKRIPDGVGTEAFFSDGVHPSALTYRLWADETMEFMVEKGMIN